ncbi:hypothetical protein HK100_003343 [Physocladia obscura]|uniref:Transmembrane protein n=1 Tax=Physocladia obscura TaxID=109957 RepID=A0AAD5X9G7_9FUNG|nr:hypothetical protein HK100_003343 [Physocladia obscura]
MSAPLKSDKQNITLPPDFNVSRIRETYVAASFTASGIFLVQESGATVRINSEYWAFNTLAVAIGHDRSQILSFGTSGLFIIDLARKSWRKLTSDFWGTAHGAIALACESVIVFGSSGVFKVNTFDGSHVKLAGGSWITLGIAFPCPSLPRDVAVILTGTSSWLFNITDGSYTKHGNIAMWPTACVMILNSDSKTATILSSSGSYILNLSDGSYKRTANSASWPRVKAALLLNEKDALVINQDCSYALNMLDGGYSKSIASESWQTLASVCDLGPNAGIACMSFGGTYFFQTVFGVQVFIVAINAIQFIIFIVTLGGFGVFGIFSVIISIIFAAIVISKFYPLRRYGLALRAASIVDLNTVVIQQAEVPVVAQQNAAYAKVNVQETQSGECAILEQASVPVTDTAVVAQTPEIEKTTI